jgi:hypothetical protein
MFAWAIKTALVSTWALVAFLGMAAVSGANQPPQYVRLYTMQPVGFGGRLTVTASSLGKVLHTADGGQIFGFDVNQNGTDGILASARTISPHGQVAASVETWDQTTLTITKTIVMTRSMDDFVAEGIFPNDVGLVLHEHVVNNTNHRSFHLLNPVTGNKFTGRWTPPNAANFLLDQIAVNQTTTTAAILGEDLNGGPLLFSSNIAADTFGPVFHLDPNHFSQADGPKIGEDIVHNKAVIATSPDAGRVGGQVPLIAIIDLATGKMRSFNGVGIPPFNSGYVNGFAVDSATGIGCTSTELDANIEFYTLADGSGFNVFLPGANGNQFNSAEAVLNDPIHKLFLVAQPNGSIGPSGDSVIYVYDEHGNLVKSITGFKAFGVTPGMVINPTLRTVYIQGPSDDALTRFTY